MAKMYTDFKDSRNELEKKTYIDLQRFQSYIHLLVSPIISYFMLPVYQIESSSSLIFCRADKVSTIDSKNMISHDKYTFQYKLSERIKNRMPFPDPICACLWRV